MYLKFKTKRQTRDTTTIEEADDVLALTILTVNTVYDIMLPPKTLTIFFRSKVIT